MGEQLLPDELELFRKFTGRMTAPERRVDEGWLVVGRRGGKTRAMAAMATYIGALCGHAHHLAKGQRGYVLIVAPDLKQASELIGYCRGIFESPLFKQLVVRQTAEEIELRNNIVIRTQTPNFRRIRGFSAVAVILDEVAFWLSEENTPAPLRC
jgi:phage terminase large subunit-like protein